MDTDTHTDSIPHVVPSATRSGLPTHACLPALPHALFPRLYDSRYHLLTFTTVGANAATLPLLRFTRVLLLLVYYAITFPDYPRCAVIYYAVTYDITPVYYRSIGYVLRLFACVYHVYGLPVLLPFSLRYTVSVAATLVRLRLTHVTCWFVATPRIAAADSRRTRLLPVRYDYTIDSRLWLIYLPLRYRALRSITALPRFVILPGCRVGTRFDLPL